MKTSQQWLICKGSSGMGNRILAVCTAVLYSQITDRSLIIDWRDGSYSQVGINAFDFFFDYPFGKSFSDLSPSPSIYPPIWRDRLDQSLGSLRQETGLADEDVSCDVSRWDYQEDILLFCAYTHKIHKMRSLFQGKFSPFADLDDRQILQKILRENLTLKPDIYDLVSSFKQTHFGQRTIGVHVRYTDIKIPLEKVIQQTQKLAKRYNSDCIFLATDAEEVIQKFNQVFQRVITAPKWFPPAGQRMHQNWDACGDRVQNGREALIDLYLLSACPYLVYSSQSSFGVVASLLSTAETRNLYNINDSSKLDRLKAKVTAKIKSKIERFF